MNCRHRYLGLEIEVGVLSWFTPAHGRAAADIRPGSFDLYHISIHKLGAAEEMNALMLGAEQKVDLGHPFAVLCA